MLKYAKNLNGQGKATLTVIIKQLEYNEARKVHYDYIHVVIWPKGNIPNKSLCSPNKEQTDGVRPRMVQGEDSLSR